MILSSRGKKMIVVTPTDPFSLPYGWVDIIPVSAKNFAALVSEIN